MKLWCLRSWLWAWVTAGVCVVAAASAGDLFVENFDSLEPVLQAAVDEKAPGHVLGWTHEPPPGWSVDASAMAEGGVAEWRGWSFTTVPFWLACENQGRDQFLLAESVFAVADSDEYDDKDNPSAFDSTLISPPVTVPAGKTAYVSWDSLYLPVEESVSTLSASIDGGSDQVIKDYHGLTLADAEETVAIPPPAGGKDWTLVLKWRYKAKNGWFWAIDNVRVADTPPAPPASGPIPVLAGEDDWPAYMYDVHRSGVTAHALPLPLTRVWTHQPVFGPCPAWPAPARRDVTNRVAQLSPTTTFDRAFHPIVAGERVFYGSSADDAVHCLELASGQERWVFQTEGPVRLAPVFTRGRVYFGSDDGFAYCVDAESGGLVWKRRGGPRDERLPGNERIVSLWPIRSSIAVAGNEAYFTAGLFPLQGVYLCAVNADTGEPVWTRRIDTSPQGYMLVSPTRLFLPTGRSSPVAFDRRRGRPLGGLEGKGGSFAILLEDIVAHGPGEDGRVHMSLPGTREYVVSAQGFRVLARGSRAYILSEGSLAALDRGRYVEIGRHIRTLEGIKERTPAQEQRLAELRTQHAGCTMWTVPCDGRYSSVLAGTALFAGGDGVVAAYDAETGAEQWRAAVEGKAHGLAVAHGRLLVASDTGAIHCFAGEAGGETPPAVAASGAESVPAPVAQSIADTAASILGACNRPKGYCFVLGAETGELACAIARASEFRVIVAEPDEEAVARIRDTIRSAKLPGTRVAAHVADIERLPYRDSLADLVVFERALLRGESPVVPASEVARLLRPWGGTAVVAGVAPEALEAWRGTAFADWAVSEGRGVGRRDALPGAGEWTHTHADLGNTACSQDTLAAPPVALQWFGPPGPERMVDRHFRNVPPLVKDGRLFIPGDEVVYAVNAYNGSPIWEAETPGSRRTGVFLDSSNMAVDDRVLYVVTGDTCLRFDVETGGAIDPLRLPGGVADVSLEWGYVARAGDLILGSQRAQGTTYSLITREAELGPQAVWYPNMKVATSAGLFAEDARAGEFRWRYPADEKPLSACGRILEATVAIEGGKVFFVESHSPKALADTSGRLTMLEVIDGGEQHLVALDLHTGAEAYRKVIDMSELQQPASLVAAQGRVIVAGSKIVGGQPIVGTGEAARQLIGGEETVQYTAYAFDAGSGDLVWSVSHNSELRPDGGHGEYNRHPVVVGDTVHIWPYAYSVATGEQVAGWKFDRLGHGCGGISASQYGLFWRGNNPWMYDLRPGGGPSRLTAITRPGCWINIIPAGGLILIPEASSGCTCPYPIQTSLAFAPVRVQ